MVQLRCLFVIAFLLATVSRAEAKSAQPQQPEAETEASDRWAILAHLALLYSPQGTIGLEVERGMHKYFAISASVGKTDEFNAATALRLRCPFRLGSTALFTGLGVGGSYGDGFDGIEHGDVAENATWVTTEGYVELRSDSGPTLRIYLGHKSTMTGDCFYSEGGAVESCQSYGGVSVAYLGSALGWTF